MRRLSSTERRRKGRRRRLVTYSSWSSPGWWMSILLRSTETRASSAPPGRLFPGGKLSSAVLENVRFDSGRHLPKRFLFQGVCKEYHKK
jgi:hypothetical protein